LAVVGAALQPRPTALILPEVPPSPRERGSAGFEVPACGPLVPAVVLTEALRGDPRKDFLEERLLGMCDVEAVDEPVARRAARLRTGAGRGSAVDAIVIAFAEGIGGVVLTQDPKDLKVLATLPHSPVAVERV